MKIGSDHLHYFLEGDADLSALSGGNSAAVVAAAAAAAGQSGAATDLPMLAGHHADIFHGQRNAFPPGRVRKNAINAKRISKNIIDSAFVHARE